MAGSSVARERSQGVYSTVTARLAGQIAMEGEFALSIEQAALDVRDLAVKRGCGVDRRRHYHDPEFRSLFGIS
jgi:hypothetical protein